MANDQSLTDLLQELIYARGPVGQEDEVRELCLAHLADVCDETTVDAAGNVVARVAGRSPEAAAVGVLAHMDELSMMVKRVKDDGTLRVDPMGGLRFGSIGQGPVEILADEGVLPGILSYGSDHTTAETSAPFEAKRENGKGYNWRNAYVVTRLSRDELKAKGVHPGTRVVVAQRRREVLGDDRAGIVVVIGALRRLRAASVRPVGDAYAVMTVTEELGGQGANYACGRLPLDIALAVDVGPAEKEYDVELSDQPIVTYRDSRSVYDKALADRLVALGKDLGMDPQRATWSSYGSDASIARASGKLGRPGLICLATANTHGYEIIAEASLDNCAALLAAFLEKGFDA